ncbi:thioredoxin-like protein [Elsinoe ampelina]|uniref:Thioredoxin-like protein n=1 Tax=Elsinoe ampelina TaxID=302913 RepID=A0A6A6GDF5_9PEZI|nr:thioredoxin-like protein [Elsinoe ampelina]
MEHSISQRTIKTLPLLTKTIDESQFATTPSQPTSTMSQVAVGQAAPDFTATAVMDGRMKEFSLSAYADAGHWTCLVFFPRAFSYICPTEIRAFSARLEEFLYSRTCAVAFISTDSEHTLRAWNHTSEMEGGLGGVHVPLVSDCNHNVTRKFGMLIESEGVSQRGLFIIDPKGVVRNISVNDADIGRSVDEVLRLIDALQFKDQFGEGCAADCKKGDEGVKMNGALKEGPIELKKSWTEWARPKLARAWSGTSGASISVKSANSFVVPSTPSPLVSPTSHSFSFNPIEKNFEAAMSNNSIGVAT